MAHEILDNKHRWNMGQVRQRADESREQDQEHTGQVRHRTGDNQGQRDMGQASQW